MKKLPVLAATTSAIACGVLVAGYPLLLSRSGLIAALGGLGLGAVAFGAFAALSTISIVGTILLVAEYLIALFISGSSFDFLSAAYAVSLLLLIEVVDLVGTWRTDPPVSLVLIERLRYLVTVVALGSVAAWLAAIAGTIVHSSLLLLGLGALGAIGAVALPLYFAREVLVSDEDG